MTNAYARSQRARRITTAMMALLLLVVSVDGMAQTPTPFAAPANFAGLAVTGDVSKSMTLSLEDLKRMPRKSIRVKNEHAQTEEAYEGVPISAILKQAGAPQGSQIRGKAMPTYVVAEGADGYQVLFSLAELDADFQDSEVLIADTADGKSIGEKFGPLRLVVPHDKRPARWVRMLTSIQVVKLNKTP